MPNIIFKSSKVVPHKPQFPKPSAKSTITTTNLTDSKVHSLLSTQRHLLSSQYI